MKCVDLCMFIDICAIFLNAISFLYYTPKKKSYFNSIGYWGGAMVFALWEVE